MIKKKASKQEGNFVLNLFKINDPFISILEPLKDNLEGFYQKHVYLYLIMAATAQVRSAAMTAGMKDLQQIQKLDSINYYTKKMSKDHDIAALGSYYALDKGLPYFSSTDKEYIVEKKEAIFNPGPSSTKMAARTIGSSETNINKFLKGSYHSFIGQITQIPIYNPTALGRYSDCTMGMLENRLIGGKEVDWVAINSTIQKWKVIKFDDYITLNPNDNLTAMERSWKIDITRVGGNELIQAKLDENESGISTIEKARRQRRNSLFM